MKYDSLMDGIEYTGMPPDGQAVLVTQDSRKVVPGAAFVCIQGRGFDGHKFAQQALDAGAGMVVTERELGLRSEIVVQNSRAAYGVMCANYFGNPAKKLTLIGVTGTNGKTTVSSTLKQVLEQCGHKCGLIGTVRSEIGEMLIPARFTTPEAWDLHALFARMVAAKCTHVVMEASSQALEQGRLVGLRFALGIFTNFSRDHLDYHGTMEEYFEAKKLLFSQSDAMLVNLDDKWGEQLLQQTEELGISQKSFAAHAQKADYLAADVELKAGSVDFVLHAEGKQTGVHFPMPGEYSVYNALSVAGAALMLGCAPQQVMPALAKVNGVPGRGEILYNKECMVVSDFAHTDDAIEKLLAALRPFVQNRMLVVYGCAGERDPAKRIPMSEAVAKYGDVIYLTSDNPRKESEEKIAKDALPPLQKSNKPYTVELDRRVAVQKALQELQPGDMLVLCGKGHEDYQVMNGYTVYLSEKQLVEEWAEKR